VAINTICLFFQEKKNMTNLKKTILK